MEYLTVYGITRVMHNSTKDFVPTKSQNPEYGPLKRVYDPSKQIQNSAIQFEVQRVEADFDLVSKPPLPSFLPIIEKSRD